MEIHTKDKLITRIISGTIRYKTAHQIITLKPPSPEIRYIAEELYSEALESAENEGLYSEQELMDMLIEEQLWSVTEEDRLIACMKDLDELKLKYFQIKFKANERRTIKEALTKVKEEIGKLQNLKHRYDYLTCHGYAASVKMKFLTGMSAHNENGPLFKSEAEYLDYDGSLINNLLLHLQENIITESMYRELARTDPWRNIWATRKATFSVFNVAATELTDEQRHLSTWSIVYDNIYESADCPSQSVIEDDDALDGWFITQRKKREDVEEQSERERILKDPRLANAHEVYLIAQSPEDVKEINKLNTTAALALRDKRINAVKQKGGTINELEMPDTKQRLLTAFNERYKNRIANGS